MWDCYQLFDYYGISDDYKGLISEGYEHEEALNELFELYKSKYNQRFLKGELRLEDILDYMYPFMLTSKNIYIFDNYCLCKGGVDMLEKFMNQIKDIKIRIDDNRKKVVIMSAKDKKSTAKSIQRRYSEYIDIEIYIAPHDPKTKKQAHFREIIFDKRVFSLDRGVLGFDEKYTSTVNFCRIGDWKKYQKLIDYYKKRDVFNPRQASA